MTLEEEPTNFRTVLTKYVTKARFISIVNSLTLVEKKFEATCNVFSQRQDGECSCVSQVLEELWIKNPKPFAWQGEPQLISYLRTRLEWRLLSKLRKLRNEITSSQKKTGNVDSSEQEKNQNDIKAMFYRVTLPRSATTTDGNNESDEDYSLSFALNGVDESEVNADEKEEFISGNEPDDADEDYTHGLSPPIIDPPQDANAGNDIPEKMLARLVHGFDNDVVVRLILEYYLAHPEKLHIHKDPDGSKWPTLELPPPRDIAKAIGVPKNDVVNALRKLRRRHVEEIRRLHMRYRRGETELVESVLNVGIQAALEDPLR